MSHANSNYAYLKLKTPSSGRLVLEFDSLFNQKIAYDALRYTDIHVNAYLRAMRDVYVFIKTEVEGEGVHFYLSPAMRAFVAHIDHRWVRDVRLRCLFPYNDDDLDDDDTENEAIDAFRQRMLGQVEEDETGVEGDAIAIEEVETVAKNVRPQRQHWRARRSEKIRAANIEAANVRAANYQAANLQAENVQSQQMTLQPKPRSTTYLNRTNYAPSERYWLWTKFCQFAAQKDGKVSYKPFLTFTIITAEFNATFAGTYVDGIQSQRPVRLRAGIYSLSRVYLTTENLNGPIPDFWARAGLRKPDDVSLANAMPGKIAKTAMKPAEAQLVGRMLR